MNTFCLNAQLRPDHLDERNCYCCYFLIYRQTYYTIFMLENIAAHLKMVVQYIMVISGYNIFLLYALLWVYDAMSLSELDEIICLICLTDVLDNDFLATCLFHVQNAITTYIRWIGVLKILLLQRYYHQKTGRVSIR